MVIDRYKTIGIGSDDDKMKLAAIFFDEVIPISKDHSIPRNLLCQFPIDYDQIKNTIELDQKKYSNSDIQLLTGKIFPTYFKNKDKIEESKVREILQSIYNEGFNKVTNLKILEISKQINTRANVGIPIYNESILISKLLDDYKANQEIDKVEVQLLNAPVINTKNIHWEQIAGAKEDPDFVNKVKRFSLFINKNYSGKDISYIVDDLSIQVEDYKNACNKHGIDLINGTLKSLANSKSLFGTFGLVLCSILFKTPEAALITGAIGGVLEAAKLKVTIKELRDEFNSFTNESPISLILELDKITKAHNKVQP